MIGGIQGTEWIFIVLIIVFFLFGAKKLPELARGIGKATGEFERGKLEIQREMGMLNQAVRAPVTELQRTVAQVAPTVSYAPPATNPAPTTTQTSPPNAPRHATPTTLAPTQPQAAPVSSAAAAVAPTGDEKERLVKAAKELGIDVENKSLQELKEEITRTMLK